MTDLNAAVRNDPSELNIVWVLGAGFSKSLGGPLLAELFQPRLMLRAKLCFPSLDSKEVDNFCDFYSQGIDEYEHERPWRHAEEFLEQLDRAAVNGVDNRLLEARWESQFSKATPMPPAADLAKMARQLLAAQCHAFATALDVEGEREQPYIAWGKQLTGRDTIVTFNYDLVVEKLAPRVRPLLASDREPHQGLKLTIDEARHCGEPLLIKVHGSVDWAVRPDECVPPIARRALAEQVAPGRDAVILAPGSRKKTHFQGLMRPLVREAENRLASADVVVFIGYRFPESDALARAMITEALANNTARLLRVVIVLGNNSPDVTRVERLVSFAIDRTNRIPLSEEKRPFTPSSRSRRYYDLRIEPLLGEEYIHGFDRRAIWHQAWRPPMP